MCRSAVELADVSATKTGITANPAKWRSLGTGPNQVQGPCCLGDYCHLLQGVNTARFKGEVGMEMKLGCDKSRPKSGFRRTSSVGLKPSVSECPFQLAFKSILLERVEIAMLGPVSTAINEGMKGCLENPDEDVRTCAAAGWLSVYLSVYQFPYSHFKHSHVTRTFCISYFMQIDALLLNYVRGHIQRLASWVRDKVMNISAESCSDFRQLSRNSQ